MIDTTIIIIIIINKKKKRHVDTLALGKKKKGRAQERGSALDRSRAFAHHFQNACVSSLNTTHLCVREI
jgi:hypothetical protein